MNLKQTAFKGASWTFTGTLLSAVLFILRPAILTRYLDKSDFGLMAILLLVVGFSHIFSDLGVSAALFSQQDISRREFSSLYWVGILVALLLLLLLILASPLLADFYNMPALRYLVPVMALELLFIAAGRQYQIILQKALRFRTLAIADISGAFVSLLLAVGLAHYGYGIYSLIWSVLAGSLLRSAILIVSGYSQYPLQLRIDIQGNRRFYRIGFYQTGSQLLDYIALNIDIILIGRLMSASDLGVYNLVKQLVVRPYGMINAVILGVSVPILSRLNDQLHRQREAFFQVLRLSAFVNFPVYALIALFATEILTIVYGPAYAQGAIWLQWLCIWGGTAALVSAASSIIPVRGRTDLGFRWTILRLLSSPLFILAGSIYALTGIVIAQALSGLVYMGVYYPVLVGRILKDLPFRSYFNSFAGLLLQALLLFAGFWFLKRVLPSDWNPLLTAFALLVFFSGVYLLLNRRQLIFLAGFRKGSLGQ